MLPQTAEPSNIQQSSAIPSVTASISTHKEAKIRKGTRRKRKLLSVLLKSTFMDIHEEKMKQVKYQNTEAQENVNVGKVSALSVADVSSRSTCVTNCREKFQLPSFTTSSERLPRAFIGLEFSSWKLFFTSS